MGFFFVSLTCEINEREDIYNNGRIECIYCWWVIGRILLHYSPPIT